MPWPARLAIFDYLKFAGQNQPFPPGLFGFQLASENQLADAASRHLESFGGCGRAQVSHTSPHAGNYNASVK